MWWSVVNKRLPQCAVVTWEIVSWVPHSILPQPQSTSTCHDRYQQVFRWILIHPHKVLSPSNLCLAPCLSLFLSLSLSLCLSVCLSLSLPFILSLFFSRSLSFITYILTESYFYKFLKWFHGFFSWRVLLCSFHLCVIWNIYYKI